MWEINTTGGLYLVLVAKSDGKVETLGTGPHRAIARHIAKMREGDLQITEIAKSATIEVSSFQHILPQWIATTEQFRLHG